MDNVTKERYNRFIEKQPLVDIEIGKYESRIIESLTYIDDGKEWRLQSCNDRLRPVEVWTEQFDDVTESSIFFVFGFGDEEYILSLKKKYPDNYVVVYEPYEECIVKMIQGCHYDEFINMKRVVIISGNKREYNLKIILGTFVEYSNYRNIVIARLPNYAKMFVEEHDKFNESILSRVEVIYTDRNTIIYREKELAYNNIYNRKRVFAEAGVKELVKAIQTVNIEGYPAVIISAGPSLDKNIQVLKLYKNRAFIICVDVALNAALKNGIVPDVVVSVDSHVGRVAGIPDEEYSTIPLVADLCCCKKYVSDYKGRIFYSGFDTLYLNSILKPYGRIIECLETGGSVANSAFSLARQLGFETIILIGQDLSYPNNKLHASNTIENEEDIDATKDSKYFYVESVDGGRVITEKNMSLYRVWFEDVIKGATDLRVIDATEGGALIHGTEIMCLKDALEECCPKEQIEFRDAINNAEYYLDKEAQKKAIENYEHIYLNIDKNIEIFNGKKKLYEKIRELNKRRAYNTKEFKVCMKEMAEFANYIEENPEFTMYELYINKTSYEIKDKLSEKERSVYEEVELSVDLGLKLTNAYIDAAEQLKNDWTEIINKEKQD